MMAITPSIPAAGPTADTQRATSLWEIDSAHSSAQFTVRHMMISNVRGEFNKVTGKVHLDESDITRSKVEAAIDVASIDTRERDRDAHLKSADFFDVSSYPTITFQSKNIARSPDGHLTLTGALTIHGIAREISLDVEEVSAPVTDPWGNLRFGVSGRGRLNRKDFGLNWNAVIEGGGILVGDQVALTLDVELVKRPS